MADLRVPPNALTPIPAGRPPAGARAERLREAQRAFFQAALDQAPQAPQAAETKPAEAKPAEPQRYLRPGSLVDIKV